MDKLKFSSIQDVYDQGFVICKADNVNDYVVSTEVFRGIIKKDLSCGMYTIDQLGIALGMSGANLWYFIKKPDRMPVGLARKLATFYEMSVEELFPYTDDAYFLPYPYSSHDRQLLDLITLEMVTASKKSEPTYHKDILYYDWEEHEGITKKRKDELLKELRKGGFDAVDVDEMLKERVSPRFVMIGKIVDDFTI